MLSLRNDGRPSSRSPHRRDDVRPFAPSWTQPVLIPGEKRCYSDINPRLQAACHAFCTKVLEAAERDVLDLCTGAVRNNFLSDGGRATLEGLLCRVYNFLASLEEPDRVPPSMMMGRPRNAHSPPEAPPAVITVTLPAKPLRPEPPKVSFSAEEERQAHSLREHIRQLNERAAAASAQADAGRVALARQASEAEQKRRLIHAALQRVRPALDDAAAGLSAIKEEHLREIRSYATPPAMVSAVMEAVLTVLGERNASLWDTMKLYMQRKDFIPMIRDFDPEGVEPSTLDKLKLVTADRSFTHENAFRASRAAAPLVRWVTALKNYGEAAAAVKPLRSDLFRLDADVARMRAALSSQATQAGELESAAKRAQDDFDAQYGARALKQRQMESNQAVDAAYNDAMQRWRDACRTARAEAYAQADAVEEVLAAQEPPVGSPAKRAAALSAETLRIVNEARRRCGVLIAAVEATVGRLKAPVAVKSLQVQRGHLSGVVFKPLLAETQRGGGHSSGTTPSRRSSPTRALPLLLADSVAPLGVPGVSPPPPPRGATASDSTATSVAGGVLGTGAIRLVGEGWRHSGRPSSPPSRTAAAKDNGRLLAAGHHEAATTSGRVEVRVQRAPSSPDGRSAAGAVAPHPATTGAPTRRTPAVAAAATTVTPATAAGSSAIRSNTYQHAAPAGSLPQPAMGYPASSYYQQQPMDSAYYQAPMNSSYYQQQPTSPYSYSSGGGPHDGSQPIQQHPQQSPSPYYYDAPQQQSSDQYSSNAGGHAESGFLPY